MSLLIYPHHGLGDHFIINGLVRSLADSQPVVLLCREDTLGTVSYMYSDQPNITTVPAAEEGAALEKSTSVLRLGYTSGDPGFNAVDYDQKFYTQAGVPFDSRWSKFWFPGMHGVQKSGGVLVHDDERFPLHITANQPMARITPVTNNLFDWLPLILGAGEIHCIPSCVFLLLDSFDTGGKKLFIHTHVRKDVTMPSFGKKWELVA